LTTLLGVETNVARWRFGLPPLRPPVRRRTGFVYNSAAAKWLNLLSAPAPETDHQVLSSLDPRFPVAKIAPVAPAPSDWRSSAGGWTLGPEATAPPLAPRDRRAAVPEVLALLERMQLKLGELGLADTHPALDEIRQTVAEARRRLSEP